MYNKGSLPSFLLSTSPSHSISKAQVLSPKPSSLPPLQRSPKCSLNNESLVKNQNSIQLTNKHSILRSFVTVDKQDASLRDDSSLNRSFKRLSAAICLLRPNVQDPLSLKAKILDSMLPIKQLKIRSKCRSVDLAQEHWRQDENIKWAEKIGKKDKKRKNLEFQGFLNELFDALDEDRDGKLSPDELILPLLAYGITNDPSCVEKSLVYCFEGKKLSEIKIEKEKFISLFGDDTRTDKTLKALEHWTKKSLQDLENLLKARRLSLGLILRSETRIQEVVPKIFCTIDQYLSTIKGWWKDLAGSSTKKPKKKLQNIEFEKIHKSKFMDFLTSKNLVSNKIEAFRLASEVESAGMIFFSSFEKIFFRALLKSGLMNLATGLNNLQFAGGDNLGIRLLRCQRKFMVSGVAVKKSLMGVQGKMALNAVCRYRDEHEDCVRGRVMKDIQEELKKADEDIEDRIHGYLYRINEDAERYLDRWGNLKSVEDAWEIKEKVKNSFEKTFA